MIRAQKQDEKFIFQPHHAFNHRSNILLNSILDEATLLTTAGAESKQVNGSVSIKNQPYLRNEDTKHKEMHS